MNEESHQLAMALNGVTTRLPRITRGVIQASKSSRPIGERKYQLAQSIAHTRALLDDLLLRQVKLGWRDDRGDSAA